MKATRTLDIDLTETETPDGSTIIVDEDRPAALPTAAAEVIDEDVDPLDRLPDHVTQNADGSVTLPLKFPQTLQVKKNGTVRSDRYEALTFHRLTGADQRAISSASDEMMTVVAFARSTRISQAVMNVLFDRLDLADISAGGQVLNSFIATGRKTGR